MSYERQTSIDKPQCPNGHGDMELKNTWELKGKGRGGDERGCIIQYWKCSKCNASTRIPTGSIKAKKRPDTPRCKGAK